MFGALPSHCGSPRLVFATPVRVFSHPALTFELCLTRALFEEPSDFDDGFLRPADDGRDVARKDPGRRLSALLGSIGSRAG